MMSRNNPRWRAPRIHGELLKLGIEITEPMVAKYMVRHRKPPSQSWRTFLENHVKSMVSVDFFTVLTIRFEILYVFLVLAHDRRRILHFGVTAHPTAEWTAQQLRETFPWDSAPRYLLRDRDQIFGKDFVDQVKAMGIKQVLSAPRSPWQRAYIERLIGSIRRECLDHVIVFGEGSLHRTLTAYCAYYHEWRTHLSLGKDTSQSRRIQPSAEGEVVEVRELVACTIITNAGPPNNTIDYTLAPDRVPADHMREPRPRAHWRYDFRPLQVAKHLVIETNRHVATMFRVFCRHNREAPVQVPAAADSELLDDRRIASVSGVRPLIEFFVGTVDPAKVVVREMQCQGRFQILPLLQEPISQPREWLPRSERIGAARSAHSLAPRRCLPNPSPTTGADPNHRPTNASYSCGRACWRSGQLLQ
jgi:transposase InsO family protein